MFRQVAVDTVVSAFPVAPGVWLSVARIAPGDARRLRARQSQAARDALGELIAAVAPSAAGSPIVADRSGAPRLAGRPDVRVSISHDADFVAAAVGLDRAVGVDVQKPVPGSADRLARRCLRRHAALLKNLAGTRRDEELAWVWTVQEACVKVRGTGLAGRPWTLDVPPFRRAGTIGNIAWRSLRELSGVPLSCAFAERGEPRSGRSL